MQFGGHTHAAGLTIKPSNYQEFKTRFEDYVASSLSREMMVPEVYLDMPIQLSDISPKMVRILKQFAPFGPGNETPIFLSYPVRDSGYARNVGDTGDHLKMAVLQDGTGPIDAIAFRQGSALECVRGKGPLQLAYSLDENTWQGKTRLQLLVRDLKSL